MRAYSLYSNEWIEIINFLIEFEYFKFYDFIRSIT